MKEHSHNGVREHKSNPPHSMKDTACLHNCMSLWAADSPDTQCSNDSIKMGDHERLQSNQGSQTFETSL